MNELRLSKLSPACSKGSKAWHWSWEGKDGDSSAPCPHSPFLSGDICQLTLAPLPPHQVLTPQLISKEPALPADPNISSLYPNQGLLGTGCQGRGSGGWEGTPLTCFHLTGWLLVSEES